MNTCGRLNTGFIAVIRLYWRLMVVYVPLSEFTEALEQAVFCQVCNTQQLNLFYVNEKKSSFWV